MNVIAKKRWNACYIALAVWEVIDNQHPIHHMVERPEPSFVPITRAAAGEVAKTEAELVIRKIRILIGQSVPGSLTQRSRHLSLIPIETIPNNKVTALPPSSNMDTVTRAEELVNRTASTDPAIARWNGSKPGSRDVVDYLVANPVDCRLLFLPTGNIFWSEYLCAGDMPL